MAVLQVPVWRASSGDGLCGVWSEDQPRDDKVAVSEAGVKCKSLLHPRSCHLLSLISKFTDHFCELGPNILLRVQSCGSLWFV